MNNIGFNYTSASIVAIVGALIAVAVTFGLHVSQDNTQSILQLVGLVLGALAAGGGAKSAALIRANVKVPEWLHFTPAALVSGIGSLLTLLVGFGLHMTQQNIQSIMELAGLISAGLVVGGGVKSSAMIVQGIHPALKGVNRTSS